tara:strand:- start:573 stop:674 length:102 start_codon:yes stop_codon:yes gene_type:complete
MQKALRANLNLIIEKQKEDEISNKFKKRVRGLK